MFVQIGDIYRAMTSQVLTDEIMVERIQKLERMLKPTQPVSRGETRNQIIRAEVTAFTAGPESTGKRPGHSEYGITASGYKINIGSGERLIAAPPEIPYGTKIYIPGYGLARVADRGEAITGNSFDVYFDDPAEAWEWGRKQLNVIVIR
jgi:3D (Asp-Asp-Asp) domain-containing protein